MAQQDNVTVLRIQLDEGATEQQLKKLVLDLEATRTAQKALTAERKAGTKSDEEFAAETVKLQQQLKGQQGEYANLTKNLDLYRRAQAGEVGNYQATQAALSLAIRQQHELAGSSGDTTEASQALTKQIAAYREELAATDAKQLAFHRNIGNYPKGSEGLEQLVQQLVTLQEQQKKTVAGTKENEEVTRRIGFVQTAAAQAGAQAGLSYEQTTAKVAQYSEALRPAAAALVEVAQAEQQASASGEATGETMQRIGFQTAAARKALDDATGALGKTNETTEQTASTTDKAAGFLGKLGDTAGKLPGPLGQTVGGLAATGRGLLTATKAALAFIATPLGLALAAIAAAFYVVKEALTATDEGQEDLAAGTAALGAVFDVLKGIVIGAGQFLIKIFTDPKEAAKDLLQFIEDQVINRIKSFGVILEGIRNGDFKQVTNGLLQYATGIENVIDKTQALTTETKRAALAAAAISREKDQLEDLEIDALARGEKQRQQAERLVATAKDRNLTEKQRLDNLDEASRLERAVLDENLKIERTRLDIIQKENAEAQRRGTLQDDQRRAEAEQLAKLARLQGEYEKEEQQRENRRSILQGGEAEKRKAEATKAKQEAEKQEEARLKALREGYALQNQLLDGQLRRVQAGSDQELSILQQKLRNSYLSELAQKDLTVKARRQIEQKYQQDTAKLEQDFTKARILAAYDEEVAALNRRLVLAQRGGQQETELKVRALEKQLERELAALDKRQDNTEKAALLRAQTERQIQDTRYAAAAAATEKFIQGEKNALDEQLAAGTLSQANYDKAMLDADVQNAQRRLAVARAFGQNTDQLEQKFTESKIAKIKSVTDTDKAEQAKRMAQAETLTNSLVSLFQETVSTTGATLEDFARKAIILLIDSVEKSIVAAEVKIIAEAFSGADSVSTYGVLGAVKAAGVIALTVAAAEGLKSALTPPPKQFAAGTVLGGASHSQGGVQMYSRSGYHYGEAEADEVVLTKGVWQNPLLRPLASQLNVLGGGRPLAPSMHMALGGITTRAGAEYLRQQAGQAIDYERLAQATARALRQSPPVTRISDVKAGLDRNEQTQNLSNS